MTATHRQRRPFCMVLPLLSLGLIPLLEGCNRPTDHLNSGGDPRSRVELLLPSEIRIVEGFTGFRNTGGDAMPERIHVVIQPMNRFGEPTRIVGQLRIEVYELLPASGDNRGTKVSQWDISLADEEDQKAHWDKATRMYTLALVLGDVPSPPGRSYVLEVVYTDPFGVRLTAKATLRPMPGAPPA